MKIFLILSVIWNLHCITCDQTLSPSKYTYLVSLKTKYNYGEVHFCSGSLIEYQWVLTAAHCFHGIYLNNIIVIVGETRPPAEEIRRKPKKIIKHEQFTRRNLKNDIALIQIDSVESSPQIQAIPLSTKDTPNGYQCTALGFVFATRRKILPERIQVLTETTISNRTCERRLAEVHVTNYTVHDETVFCSVTRRGSKTCPKNNFGGPLVRSKELVGVASWSWCSAGGPDGWTRVSRYVDWISKKINASRKNFIS